MDQTQTKLQQALALLPDGFYVHNLTKFVNGTVKTTRKGAAHVPIEIGIEQLGSPFSDFRAVLNPADNKLVPLLLIIEPEVVFATHKTALQRYNEAMVDGDEPDPIERLRFFCSLAMSGQDWLDSEPFFDDTLARGRDHAGDL